MYDFSLTPESTQDLAAIQEYIARDNPPAAARVIRECFRCFAMLAESPCMGHAREDITPRTVRF